MIKLMGSPTSDFTFTYHKGAKNTSLVDLLPSKGVVNSHSFHKVSHSFSKVVPSERTSIATGIAIIDNIKLAIHVGGHTPKLALLDTGAQPVIFIIQFAKKMGMFDSKLRKFMWQIRTASGNIGEVLGESLDLIALNFNEVMMCSLGKRPYFHRVSQLTTGSNMRTTKWIGRLMATT
jgi:hypothetical protein